MTTHTSVISGASLSLDDVAAIGKALADPGRLRIVAALGDRELCVCHLVTLLDRDASTVSRHVAVLRRAGLVAVRREGRWVHCRRADPSAAIWEAIDGLLADVSQLDADRESISSLSTC